MSPTPPLSTEKRDELVRHLAVDATMETLGWSNHEPSWHRTVATAAVHAAFAAIARASAPAGAGRIALLIDNIVRDVAELPDRTSPPDDPDSMLVSHGELRDILWRRLEERPAPFVDAPPPILADEGTKS